MLVEFGEGDRSGAARGHADQVRDAQGFTQGFEVRFLTAEASAPSPEGVVEAVRPVGDPEGVNGIGSERVYQRGDLGGVDFSVAGADRMDAVGRQFVT